MLKKAFIAASALVFGAGAQAQYYGGYGRLYGGQGYYGRPLPIPYRIDYPLFFSGYYQASPAQMFEPLCEPPAPAYPIYRPPYGGDFDLTPIP